LGKLLSVRIDLLTASQFPIGQYSEQAADLIGWSGEANHPDFVKLLGGIEARLTPSWLIGAIEAKDHVLASERTARTAAEGQVRALRDQCAREADVGLIYRKCATTLRPKRPSFVPISMPAHDAPRKPIGAKLPFVGNSSRPEHISPLSKSRQ
jgi:hypothetical protein